MRFTRFLFLCKIPMMIGTTERLFTATVGEEMVVYLNVGMTKQRLFHALRQGSQNSSPLQNQVISVLRNRF